MGASAAPPGGVGHRQIWSIAGPIILSNMSVPILGAVDTAVVGHLPDPAYIGAVAVGAVIFSFLYWGFGFLRMGTTGFTAQAAGGAQWAELRAVLARGLIVSLALGLAIVALQWPVLGLSLWLVEASGEVETLAAEYFAFRVWGAPAALANYVLLGWFIGMQRTRIALVIQLFMNGLNIVLDLLFVLGFGWDVAGVAAATAISEYSAVALGLVVTLRTLRPMPGAFDRTRLADRDRLVAFLRVNGDIFIRTICLIFSFAYFTAQSARMGEITLAANAVLLHFQSIMAYGLDGFAFAAEALVGGAIGARDRHALRRAVVVSTQWALIVALAFVATYAVLGSYIVAILTGIPSVRLEAATYLPWAVVSPLLSVWSFQLDGIFIGATRTAEMRNAMILSLAVYLAALHILVPLLGNHGLWLALMVLMAVRALSLAVYYPRLERAAG